MTAAAPIRRCMRWSILVWEHWFLCGMVGVGALRYAVRVVLLYRSKCASLATRARPCSTA